MLGRRALRTVVITSQTTTRRLLALEFLGSLCWAARLNRGFCVTFSVSVPGSDWY